MVVRLNLSVLRQTKWYEIVLRFLFGGLATVATGLIAKSFGPVVGGLFLAFPAIFPATATLVEKHVKEKKRVAGIDGVNRASCAVALEARGATMGSIGLAAFAIVCVAISVRQTRVVSFDSSDPKLADNFPPDLGTTTSGAWSSPREEPHFVC
jgi:hypothetical protein